MSKQINIREELNRRDMNSCTTDFVNMYECANLSLDKKKSLVKLLSENVSNKRLSEFFKDTSAEYWTASPSEYDIIDSWGNDKEAAIESCKRNGYRYVVKYYNYSDGDGDWEIVWDSNIDTIKESIDYSNDDYLFKPYWYFTKHGVGPGSIPNYIHVLGVVDTDNGSYFASDKVIQTKDLEEYELKEKTPDTDDIDEKVRINIQNWLEDPIEENLSNKKLKEALSATKLEQEIRDTVRKMFASLDDEDYNDSIGDYLVVEIKEENGRTKVEVRAELSYTQMHKLANRLDEIIQKYDGDAYFDFEDSGIINAYISKSLKESLKENIGEQYLVEIQPDTEQETFNDYAGALDYFNARVSDYKKESRNSDVSVALHKVVDGEIIDTLEYWKKDETLKEEYGYYKDEPYCEEIADDLENGIWVGETNNGTSWELTINGYSSDEFSPSFADYLAEEVAYPVRDGHLAYIGIELILYKSSMESIFGYDDLNRLIPDLVLLGISRKEIDRWLKDPDPDAELITSYNFDIAFDVDEWEENNREEDEFEESLKESHTNTNKQPLKPATFTIDDTHPFEGYDEEYDWNGWECPWFTKEVGDTIVDYYKDYMHFNAEKDAFAYVSPDDDGEIEYFVGQDIETVDGIKHLYPIGNKSWIWDKYSESEDLEEDYTHFTYKSGANPYIAKTNKEAQRILNKYKGKVKETKKGFYEIDDTKEDGFITESASIEDEIRKRIANLPIGKELVINKANGILTNNKMHIKKIADNKYELFNTGFDGGEFVKSDYNSHSTLENAVHWALDKFVSFENTLKESTISDNLLSNEEFVDAYKKQGFEGAEIILDWDKEQHTFEEWEELLLNTYLDLEQDLLAQGDFETVKHNRETYINRIIGD